MYGYLVGCGILGLIWLLLARTRRDLLRPMVWSGVVCVGLFVTMFLILRGLYAIGLVTSMVEPDYWKPPTLFDLAHLTNGVSLEDQLFNFLIAGIATALYDELWDKRIKLRLITHRHHSAALIVGAVASLLFAVSTSWNIVYAAIVFFIVAAGTIWIQRRDLIVHSVAGGFTFAAVYFLAFYVFLFIYPEYVEQYYVLRNTTGIFVAGVPFEEILFGFSFGLLWSLLYEYVFEANDVPRHRLR